MPKIYFLRVLLLVPMVAALPGGRTSEMRARPSNPPSRSASQAPSNVPVYVYHVIFTYKLF